MSAALLFVGARLLRAVAVFTWGDPYDAAEDLAEVTLVHKAGACPGFNDGKLRMAEKFFCLFDAPAQNVLVRAFSSALFEPPGEVVEIQTRDFCQHA